MDRGAEEVELFVYGNVRLRLYVYLLQGLVSADDLLAGAWKEEGVLLYLSLHAGSSIVLRKTDKIHDDRCLFTKKEAPVYGMFEYSDGLKSLLFGMAELRGA